MHSPYLTIVFPNDPVLYYGLIRIRILVVSKYMSIFMIGVFNYQGSKLSGSWILNGWVIIPFRGMQLSLYAIISMLVLANIYLLKRHQCTIFLS